VPVGSKPTEVDSCLHVQQVDAQGKFEQSWGDISAYLLAVLDAVGVDRIAAEELTVLPGAEEVLALLEVRDQARSGRFLTVGSYRRLLALPVALRSRRITGTSMADGGLVVQFVPDTSASDSGRQT